MKNTKINVVILAGGKGSRLKDAIGENAKILAKINNIPFIDYLDSWVRQGFKDVDVEIYLSTGCYHCQIQDYITSKKMRVKIIQEKQALGTLGGAANVAKEIDEGDLLILNGDTLFDCNLESAYQEYLRSNKIPVLIVQSIDNNQRYGGYQIGEGNRLHRAESISNLVSLGAIFASKKELVNYDKNARTFGKQITMMDDDFIHHARPLAYEIPNSNRFIDIGIPESLEEAQTLIPSLVSIGDQNRSIG